MGRFQLELIYRPSIKQLLFLSCRPFVDNGQKQQLFDGRTVENKGKLTPRETLNLLQNILQIHDIKIKGKPGKV